MRRKGTALSGLRRAHSAGAGAESETRRSETDCLYGWGVLHRAGVRPGGYANDVAHPVGCVRGDAALATHPHTMRGGVAPGKKAETKKVAQSASFTRCVGSTHTSSSAPTRPGGRRTCASRQNSKKSLSERARGRTGREQLFADPRTLKIPGFDQMCGGT
jgi:hypothetical protein